VVRRAAPPTARAGAVSGPQPSATVASIGASALALGVAAALGIAALVASLRVTALGVPLGVAAAPTVRATIDHVEISVVTLEGLGLEDAVDRLHRLQPQGFGDVAADFLDVLLLQLDALPRDQ